MSALCNCSKISTMGKSSGKRTLHFLVVFVVLLNVREKKEKLVKEGIVYSCYNININSNQLMDVPRQ